MIIKQNQQLWQHCYVGGFHLQFSATWGQGGKQSQCRHQQPLMAIHQGTQLTNSPHSPFSSNLFLLKQLAGAEYGIIEIMSCGHDGSSTCLNSSFHVFLHHSACTKHVPVEEVRVDDALYFTHEMEGQEKTEFKRGYV